MDSGVREGNEVPGAGNSATVLAAGNGRHARQDTEAGDAPGPAPGPSASRWRAAARGICRAGFFGAGITGGAVFGRHVAALILAAEIAAPFAAALLLLYRDSYRRRQAWHRSQVYAFPAGPPAVLPVANAAQIAVLQKQVAAYEHRVDGCEGQLDLIRDGLAAAFDAADLAWPPPRPYLRLVSGEHATQP